MQKISQNQSNNTIATEELESWEDLYDEEERKIPTINTESVTEEPKDDDLHNAESSVETTATTDQQKQSNLRSPICCVLGHVDTGKTSLLDRIRNTNVQGSESGGITQQIGATFFPMDALQELMDVFQGSNNKKLTVSVPGLLIIDTPGHETFYNLRKRGSSLCDIAILVIDITHGFQHQTLENIEMLKNAKVPFVVAVNKVDKIYGWQSYPDLPINAALAKQTKDVQRLYEAAIKDINLKFAEKGLNSVVYYKNRDHKKWISLVPVSAKTGDGISDLLMLTVQVTQSLMKKRLEKNPDKVDATVFDVRAMEGLGPSLDVLLIGKLSVGDTIAMATLGGAITTTIKGLLTPKPMKEIRAKSVEFDSHSEIDGTLIVKILVHQKDFDMAAVVPGTKIVTMPNSKGTPSSKELEALKKEAAVDMQDIFKKLVKVGVYVHASTIGSLEALLVFLIDKCHIPVFAVNVGPVHKKDVMKAAAMLDPLQKHYEYGVLLAFDVKVTPEANDLAKELGLKIFQADIIYHLEKMWNDHIQAVRTATVKELGNALVFPALLRVLPDCIFNQATPIIVGVEIKDGTLRVGTPLVALDPKTKKPLCFIGRVTSIQHNHKDVEKATKNSQVAIKIDMDNDTGPARLQIGRHFPIESLLCSRITTESLEILEQCCANDISKEEHKLAKKLNKLFG